MPGVSRQPANLEAGSDSLTGCLETLELRLCFQGLPGGYQGQLGLVVVGGGKGWTQGRRALGSRRPSSGQWFCCCPASPEPSRTRAYTSSPPLHTCDEGFLR